MRRLALLFALAGLLAPSAAQAIIPTPQQSLQIAYNYWEPDAYCNGSTPERSVEIVWDPTLNDRGFDGLAIGVVLFDDGTYFLSSCTIAIQPGLPTAVECRVIMHEVGHLNNHRHSEGGVMSSPVGNIDFWRCDPTPREAVIAAVRDQLPESPYWAWTVHCNKSLTRCKGSSPRAKYARRFEVLDKDPGAVYPL